MSDNKADLAGPGIGTYAEVARMLHQDYEALLAPMQRTEALYEIKAYTERELCNELNLQMVQVPLIVTRDSGPTRSGRRRSPARLRAPQA